MQRETLMKMPFIVMHYEYILISQRMSKPLLLGIMFALLDL